MDRGIQNSETRDQKAEARIAEARRRVLDGEVNAYEEIYRTCNGPLRSFIGSRYGHLGDDFVSEVAIITHEYVCSNLNDYNSDKGASFQTWMNRRALKVAGRVLADRLGLRRLGPRGTRRRRVAVSESFNEEAHATRAGSVPGPAEEHEAKMRSRQLWQEYTALARNGRLSIALHDLAGRTLKETAKRLDLPLIRVRRLLEQNHKGLARRLRRRGFRPVVPEPHYGRVWHEPDDTGYDDDWTATVTAVLPDGPDSLVGSAAKSEEEDEETP